MELIGGTGKWLEILKTGGMIPYIGNWLNVWIQCPTAFRLQIAEWS
jgi:hypothetical protein